MKRKKSFVGYVRTNWEDEFYIHDITGRILKPEIYKSVLKYKQYGTVDYILTKVKITIEEIGANLKN